MKTFAIILGVLAILLPGASADEMPYPGFPADQRLLRSVRTEHTGEFDISASTNAAIAAARRVFSKIAFLYKPKAEVLELLGDPATISSYGIKAKEGKDAMLIYRFQSGFGGCDYRLKFTNGVVTSVEAIESK